MKKNLLAMLTAILFCGFTVTWLSACSSDNDDKTETAEEVAAWCAQSPTVAFTVSNEGYAKQTSVDFGGNDGGSGEPKNGLSNYLCKKIMSFLGYSLIFKCD